MQQSWLGRGSVQEKSGLGYNKARHHHHRILSHCSVRRQQKNNHESDSRQDLGSKELQGLLQSNTVESVLQSNSKVHLLQSSGSNSKLHFLQSSSSNSKLHFLQSSNDKDSLLRSNHQLGGTLTRMQINRLLDRSDMWVRSLMSRVRVKLRVNITLRHTFSCVWLSQKPRCIVLCCSCDQLGEVCFAAAVIS